jgi:8-oxo-dGTP diphosphatase
MLKPSVKLWLKKGSVSVIGSGRARLLQAINEHGSISKAAAEMNMSYRHAWGIVRHIRDSVDDDVVITKRGGSSGGGTELTKLGKQILKQYFDNEKEIENLLMYGPKPSLAVDGVVVDKNNNLVLIRRKNQPYQDQLALPGGFVEKDETTEAAVMREVREELGIRTKIKRLLGVYSDPKRDPRQHIVSVVYELEPLSGSYKAGDDAASFERVPVQNLKKIKNLAFDHDKIISDVFFNKK